MKVYVGSTASPLSVRLAQHLHHYELYKQGKHNYITSFEVIKEEWHEICLEETIEFENVNELLQAERRAYDKYKTDDDYIVVNVNVPARDSKEYYSSAVGKESIRRYHQTEKGKAALARANRKYYEKHRERKIQKMRQSYAERKAQLNAPVEGYEPTHPTGKIEN